LFASVLSAVAGYVDAIGFLMTGGYFVSFMSGNSTRLAVGLAEGASQAGLALALVASFVGGAATGAGLGRVMQDRRAVAVLALVSALLATAAVLAGSGPTWLAVLPLAFAMGAENTVFAEDGEVRIGVTYMTGTLVKLGKHITAALTGGDRLGWAPYLLLWLGLVAGAVLGAWAYAGMGARALWVAAAAMALLAAVAPRVRFAAVEARRAR
jgi:uncharacterized membrane protein YoaK (UPF0700 family)